MIDKHEKDIADLEEVEKNQIREERVLCSLLDKYGSQQDQYFAVRGHMGTSLNGSGKPVSVPSYSTMHSLSWVASGNIYLGSEMDFMSKAIDPETGKLVIDEESAETLKQRAPDWSRQADLATYLIQDKHHKFGTILAVLSPSWVDDPQHENWGKDGRAIKNSVEFRALDSRGDFGMINLENTRAYALDGQHRVMGIRGLKDILEGALILKNREGKETKRIPKDDILPRIHADVTDLTRLLEEKLSVEYIPAVVSGETRDEASRRIRSVFVAINNYAKLVDRGENILLSENDGCSIVARKLGHCLLFVSNEGTSRVNWKNTSIPASDDFHIITLKLIQETVSECLKRLHEDYDWSPYFNTVPIRPSETEISTLEGELKSVFEAFTQLPIFRKVAQGDSIRQLREFPTEGDPDRCGHLLLRPIGIKIISAAICDSGNLDELEKSIRKLVAFDNEGGFHAHNPSSLFYGVTYNPLGNKMYATAGAQALARDIVIYLLNGASEDKRDSLADRIKDSRRITDTEWTDFNGKDVDISTPLELPLPIKV